MTPKKYTVSEAAEYLKISPGRVRQLLIAGRLHGKKFGRDWQITQKALDSKIIQNRKRGRPKKK